jgi:hypothetical protein
VLPRKRKKESPWLECDFDLVEFCRIDGGATPVVSGEKDRILQEKEAELRRMQDMLTKMQAQMQQAQNQSN